MNLLEKYMVKMNDAKGKSRVAYQIYSELLGCYLWVVQDDANLKALRHEGITEPIYTDEDIRHLSTLPEEAIKKVHKVKEAFPLSTIKESKRYSQ